MKKILFILFCFVSIQAIAQNGKDKFGMYVWRDTAYFKVVPYNYGSGVVHLGIDTVAGSPTFGKLVRKPVAAQGADVASVAGAIALGADGNAFEITGTNAITLISNLIWQNGAVVTLAFTSTATLTDSTANSGTDIGMELAGNTNFVASAGATLTLRLLEIGGTQRWREIARSVQ